MQGARVLLTASAGAPPVSLRDNKLTIAHGQQDHAAFLRAEMIDRGVAIDSRHPDKILRRLNRVADFCLVVTGALYCRNQHFHRVVAVAGKRRGLLTVFLLIFIAEVPDHVLLWIGSR